MEDTKLRGWQRWGIHDWKMGNVEDTELGGWQGWRILSLDDGKGGGY